MMKIEENKKSLFNIIFVSIEPESEFHSIETRKIIVARCCTESEIKKEIDILNNAYKEYTPLGGYSNNSFENYKKNIIDGLKSSEYGKYSLRVLDEKDSLFKITLPYGLDAGKYFTYERVEYLERCKFGKEFFESDFLKNMDLEKYKKEML